MKARISLVFVFLLVIVHVPSSAISRRIGVNCCSKTFDLSTNVKFVIRTANYYALNYSTCSNTFKLGNSCPSMVVNCRKRIKEIGNPVDSTPDGLNFTYGETTARLLRNPKIPKSKMQVCNSDMSSCTTTQRKIRTNETAMTVSFKTDSTDDGYGYTCTIKCDACDAPSIRCNTGKCVPSEEVCDGKRDCPDGEDEANCGIGFETQDCIPGTPGEEASCSSNTIMNQVAISDNSMVSVAPLCCNASNLVTTFYDEILTAAGSTATCPPGTFATALCADTSDPQMSCGGSMPAATLLICSTAVWDGTPVQPGSMCTTVSGASGDILTCPSRNEVITSICVSATMVSPIQCDGAYASIVCCNVEED